jgi:hypothetical protein
MVTIVTAVLLIALPILFNAAFALLAAAFDYPDILRRPSSEVLARFRAGGSRLVLLWWAFAMTAVLFVPLAVMLPAVLAGASDVVLLLSTVTGVLAGSVQFLGLIRWPFLVPYLARVDAGTGSSAARHEAVDIVFQAFNRYLGVAVGEHLGYLLTGMWSVLVGVALTQSDAAPGWLGLAGIVIGVVLAICSLEFVGPAEPAGWKLAGLVIPVAYITWSAWLLVTGIFVLI